MGPFGSRLIEGGGFALLAQRPATAWTKYDLTLVFTDLAMFAAYAVIPLLILYFFVRRRPVHFSWVWFLLVVYLVIAATVHVLDACGGWQPIERVAAVMKVVLAFVAWIWVIVLIPLVPKLLEARSDEEFSQLLSKHEEAEQARR